MKPFLLLQSRPEDDASDNEYQAFYTFSNLKPNQLHRIRMEATPLPPLKLDDYSGIIVGGGPFNTSDPEDTKSSTQKRVEAALDLLLDEIYDKDIPFLGACYGIGALGTHQGGVIDRTYGEGVGPTTIRLTEAAQTDPLLANLPASFDAFVGHKEACSRLPAHATLLAFSQNCPVQMFKVKNNIYATQFHPELDSHGLETRIKIYKHAGYFPPEEAEKLIATGHAANVTYPVKILENFIKIYHKQS
jgi:GMP synthase (glutamine-hydrolysing)